MTSHAAARTVHVLAATGNCGVALCRDLLADGIDIVPITRRPDKWAGMMVGITARRADLTDHEALAAALADAEIIVSAAHAAFTAAVLAAAPPGAQLVLMGSTRRFTRWPDHAARLVVDAEAAFLQSGRKGVMLHPTMIYGAPNTAEENIHRLAAMLRRLSILGRPLVPLPQGGRALIQPIFLDDVVQALRAAIAQPWARAETLVVAGPMPVTYAAFLRAVAAAAGLSSPFILPLPLGALRAAAETARHVPGLPHVARDELRRLCEDRAFDIVPARQRLGFDPVVLAEGLRRSFPRST